MYIIFFFTQTLFNSVVMSLCVLYEEVTNGWQDVLDKETGGNFLLDHRERGEEGKIILSVWVDEEAREGAVFVGVSPVNFAPVQLNTHFVADVQVQDDTVGGVVVVLICILGDCTGPHL
ncbi:hypothetical protein XENORESO_015913, partial [Xenotaenia resolanae]